MKNKFIYFDHASTSPLSKNVLNAINYASTNYWGNTSSKYNFGVECSFQLEKIRLEIAQKFNTKSENIIFTSGSSESISLVFNKLSDKYKKGELLISKVEHNATLISANILKNRGWIIKEIDVDSYGLINVDNIINYLSDNLKFISIIWGQSEIGSIQPVQEIGRTCLNRDTIVHIDATQVIANGLFNWDQLNCDLLSFSAHKFGGPKGIGILLCNDKSRDLILNPDISLSHEYSIRAGTQSIPLISGLNTALSNIKQRINFCGDKPIFEASNAYQIRDYLLELFKKNNHVKITGSITQRLPNHLSFILLNKSFNPIKAHHIVSFMSENNIAISNGSACSNSKKTFSSVLKNMGYNSTLVQSNIRVSFNNENTKTEVDKFYNLIIECINHY